MNETKQNGSRRARSIGLVVAGLLVTLLCAGAVAAWAYDDAKEGEIAEGVTVAGVDVGGMTGADAKRRLNQQLVRPLRRPIVVGFQGEKWRLSAEQLNARAPVKAAVADALEASRDQGLVSRVWRYATGGEVDRNIPLSIKYSKPAVTEFVKGIADEVNRDPVDASVDPSGTSLQVVGSEPGRQLRDQRLTEQIRTAATDASAPRRLRALTITTKPQVTVDELASSYPYYLTLDRSSYELRLWRDLELAETYTVAVGKVGMDTPAGLYSIQSKAIEPDWYVPDSDWAGDLAGQVIPGGTPENPLKARWLGIYDGVGIHGTSDTGSLGSAASHGCIRMAIPEVIELYDEVPIGTPIYIA